MEKISLWNLIIGFLVIFFAACAGPFLALDATKSFIHDPGHLQSWTFTLMASAHGHTNLFGILHCLFGLSFPYSAVSKKHKYLQTIGLSCGTFSMSVLMVFRASGSPVEGFDVPGLLTGVLLSFALLAIGSHCLGLMLKLRH